MAALRTFDLSGRMARSHLMGTPDQWLSLLMCELSPKVAVARWLWALSCGGSLTNNDLSPAIGSLMICDLSKAMAHSFSLISLAHWLRSWPLGSHECWLALDHWALMMDGSLLVRGLSQKMAIALQGWTLKVDGCGSMRMISHLAWLRSKVLGSRGHWLALSICNSHK